MLKLKNKIKLMIKKLIKDLFWFSFYFYPRLKCIFINPMKLQQTDRNQRVFFYKKNKNYLTIYNLTD